MKRKQGSVLVTMNDTREVGRSSSDTDIQMSDAPPVIDEHNHNDNGNSSGIDVVPVKSSPNVSDRSENEDRTESIVSIDSAAQEMHTLKPVSRVPEIWSNFFRKLHEIEQMEIRVNEHVSRSRRRIMNLLEQTPAHRRTHLRMFVSHFFDKFKEI